MIVGYYSLHLYCDTEGCVNAQCAPSSDGIGRAPGEFTHEKNDRGGAFVELGAIAKAQKAGWKLNLANWTCYCPSCARQ